MWKYLSIPKDGETAKRQKVSDSEKKDRSKIYEDDKRTRTWSAKWTKNRPWLEYDSNTERMFCNYCKSNAPKQKRGPFCNGTNNFKLDRIKDHEVSQGHKASTVIELAKKQPQKSEAVRVLLSLTKVQTSRLDKLFRTAHAVAKKGRPFTDFEWLCELDDQKGIDIGDTYRNRKQASTFVGYIAEAERQHIIETLSGAKFVSVMSDGSTDSDIVEEEIIYSRVAIRGEVFVKFMSLEPVAKANAENITNAISNGLRKGLGLADEEWKKKLVAVGTDGAAVMVGKKTGVVTRLKEDRPYVIGVHCMAHRLELSFKDAVKENTCHKKLDTLLLGLYYFYHNSPLNRANLRTSYETLDMKPALMPTRVGGTRWVGHQHRALDHFLRGYPAFMQHLEQIQSPDAAGVNGVQQAKARNFYKIAKSLHVMKYACFTFDVLGHLSVLSSKIQEKTVSMAGVHNTLRSTKSVLIKYKSRPGPMLDNVTETLDKTAFKLKGVTLTGDDALFKSSSTKLIDDLVVSIENRFQDIEDSVLHATCIADLSFWPDKENMEEFGDLEVKEVVEHFKQALVEAGAEPSLIADEWTILKSKVYDQPGWRLFLQNVSWQALNRMYSNECTNILLVIDLLLCLPASSAECERGFNRMKQIKTDWRSRLGSTSLNNRMVVLLQSPDIKDFNPTPAVKLWTQDVARVRRPEFMNKAADDQSESEEEETVNVSLSSIIIEQ